MLSLGRAEHSTPLSSRSIIITHNLSCFNSGQSNSCGYKESTFGQVDDENLRVSVKKERKEEIPRVLIHRIVVRMDSSFLSIPREIREQIIEFALLALRDAPHAPPLSPIIDPKEHGREQLKDDLGYWAWSPGPKRVFYDTSVSPAELVTNSALLLTSRQICAETRYVLEHLRRTKQLHYALDIMFVNEDSLWPTWLGMPALATHIDNLTATIRICGPAGNMKYWRGGDGCGPFNVWVYYALMERFFRCGALSFNTRVAHRDLDRGITVGTLVIDVISPTADKTKLWPDGEHE